MVMMAIATEKNSVAQNLGKCLKYTLITVENGREIGRKTIEDPGHEPDSLPGFLQNQGVSCVVAGGVNPTVLPLLDRCGIEVMLGITGSIDEIVHSYLKGTLKPGRNVHNS
jgi:predicted Fe-Mo cluster-binding NifX family protein